MTSVTRVHSDRFFVEQVRKETLVKQEQRQQKGIANTPTTDMGARSRAKRGGGREGERVREREREKDGW